MFPEDVTYLGSILDMDIEAHHIVWITKKSTLYHNNPHCSGMKFPIETEFDTAINLGYNPCRRCFYIADQDI